MTVPTKEEREAWRATAHAWLQAYAVPEATADSIILRLLSALEEVERERDGLAQLSIGSGLKIGIVSDEFEKARDALRLAVEQRDEARRERDEARAAAKRLRPWVQHGPSCPKCGGSECKLCAAVSCDCGLVEALDATKGATS